MDSASFQRIWVKEYPKGVAGEVDTQAYASLADLIETSSHRFGGNAAFEMMDAALSFDDVDRLSRDFASYLQNVAGLNKGDRVAVMMPNVLQYPVAAFGILRAGMVVVNVNPLYTPRELEHQLNDSGARAIVIVENFATTLQQVVGRTPVKHVITTQVADLLPFPKGTLVNFVAKRIKKMVPAWRLPGAVPFRTALARGRAQPFSRVKLTQADIAFLQYTGVSKGATLTHGNVIANVLQNRAFMAPFIEEGRELILTALPLYHIFALTINCFLMYSIGAKNVLITNPRDLPGFVKEWSKHHVTVFTGVNTLFNGLLHTPGFEQLDFSGMKLAIGGGAAVQQAVAEKWRQVTGKPLSEGYGLSETSPTVTTAPFDKPDWNGTIGVPLPSTLVSIRDDDGNELPQGQPGELCVKGPQVMTGYWQKPEENKKVFTADGFLKTGDVAVMTEKGYFRIVDRKKDMILVSGFNVYPNEVEGVVAMHPGVLEVAAVGVPDERSGEAVKIFVVRKDPQLTEQDLIAFCKKELTGYKVPHLVEFRTELPKTNVGKILRRALRDAPVNPK